MATIGCPPSGDVIPANAGLHPRRRTRPPGARARMGMDSRFPGMTSWSMGTNEDQAQIFHAPCSAAMLPENAVWSTRLNPARRDHRRELGGRRELADRLDEVLVGLRDRRSRPAHRRNDAVGVEPVELVEHRQVDLRELEAEEPPAALQHAMGFPQRHARCAARSGCRRRWCRRQSSRPRTAALPHWPRRMSPAPGSASSSRAPRRPAACPH